MEVILKLGGLQAFLIGGLLLRKRPTNNANGYLSLLLFLVGIQSLLYSISELDIFIQFPHIIRIDWGIPLLFGPLVYLYTLSLTNQEKILSNSLYIHFIPYLLNLLILLPFFLKSGEEKILILDYFSNSITIGTDIYTKYYHLLRAIICVISVVYGVKAIQILKNYKTSLISEFSSIDKLQLNWLRGFLISFLILSSIFLIITFLLLIDAYPVLDYDQYYFGVTFILIYSASYKALNQPEILHHSIETTSKKEATSKPQSTELTQLANDLKNHMTENKPHLKGELTATELSSELDISRHKLSQILSDELQTNFYDFVNSYRIEEFKNRISSPSYDHLTLLAIAFDSGFNSKTSFNTIFKKACGKTPSQYKKSIE